MTFLTKILFVCTGNTCRSAMAEAIWRAMGASDTASAGVAAWSGQPAASNAIKAVEGFGGSLEGHRARNLEEIDWIPDLVLTMTKGQKDRVMERFPTWAEKTCLLSEAVGECGEITDPIGQDLSFYEAVANEINRLLIKLKRNLDEQSEKNAE